MQRILPTSILLLAFLLTCILPGSAWAEDEESDLEREARRARRGAGLRVGTWNPVGLSEPSGSANDSSPLFEGYFQKGLDKHLAWVNNIGLWRRTQVTSSDGGLLGGSSTETTRSYVLPLFTAVKFHPFTEPGHRLEPFVDLGAGFALGISQTSSTGGTLPSGSGDTMLAGYGFQAGTGADFWLSPMFGVGVHGRYQWVRFSSGLNGEDTFKGFGLDLGLTYRFQY